jgi:hypothetical protein
MPGVLAGLGTVRKKKGVQVFSQKRQLSALASMPGRRRDERARACTFR